MRNILPTENMLPPFVPLGGDVLIALGVPSFSLFSFIWQEANHVDAEQEEGRVEAEGDEEEGSDEQIENFEEETVK